MNDQPPTLEDQPAASGDLQGPTPALANSAAAADPAVSLVPPATVEQPAPVNPQTVTGDDTTFEPPPGLEAAMKAARTVSTGLMAIPELIRSMGAACPRLATILGSTVIRTSLECYLRQDAESMRQQELLRREAFWANLCLLAAGVIGGLILAVSAGALGSLALGPFKSLSATLADESVKRGVILFLGLLTLVLGAFAAYFAYVARDQGRITRWQTCRVEAEAARLDVFSTIASGAVGRGKDVALFGFAVIVTHLLGEQRGYLELAVKRHRESSEGTTRMGAAASALAFVGGSGAVIASQTGGSGAVWIVLAGIVGSAIGALAANREALNRDRANAERYDKTLVAMNAFAARVDSVAAKIAAGQPEALSAFTKTIADLLSAENKQWMDATAQANSVIDKLDEQLSQLGKAKGSDAERK